uniref:ATP synthase complex subunit 8 n=1 Tax=Perodicticus potto edwarsi TaxID=9473 RepID=S4UTZ0_PERPO|nr:ATP synthase subunit 8 [Perodicticus potto edwarsi]
MPQLDTSTWTMTILSTILTLFILFQLKLLKFTFTTDPSQKPPKLPTHTNPWDKKWTKTYLPLSLPPQ